MTCCCGGRYGAGIAVGAAVLAASLGVYRGGFAEPDAAKPPPAKGAQPAAADRTGENVSPFVLDYKMNLIDGKEEDLHSYKGKVVLMVNVASKCGYTPQYEGLEKLYESRKDRGFVVLGFPANDFGKQEPGTNKEISEFCSTKYKVTFPMFEKIGVVGERAHPLFQRLAAQPAPIGGPPKWNFTKFLVDRKGNVVARYDSKVRPEDSELSSKIDELLSAKP